MSDRAALLAAVAAAPDDPTPRLVFADWLDDNGDADWAWLIRLQNGYFTDWTNADDMREREQELVGLCKDRFPTVPGLSFGPPARGFPERVSFPPFSDFAEAGVTAIMRWPVVRFRFFGPSAPGIPTFSASGLGDRAIAIDVSGVFFDNPEQLRPFLGCLTPGRLVGFTAVESLLRDAEIEILAASPAFAGLREMDLEDNNFTAAGAAALVASPYLGNLRYLNLAGNPIPDLHALERRFGDALRLA